MHLFTYPDLLRSNNQKLLKVDANLAKTIWYTNDTSGQEAIMRYIEAPDERLRLYKNPQNHMCQIHVEKERCKSHKQASEH